MNKLREAGLYMSGLYPIKGKMIDRYNQCLQSLGFQTTALTEIHIDAIGWSPEVAEEMGNNYYLNHGGANPYGIILSPEQFGKAVFFPYHSFDRDLVEAFYNLNEASIKDITVDAAITINLDQNIAAFYEPSDLIDYSNITVGYKIIGELDREQIKQNILIQKMYQGHNCLDMNLHNKILASSNQFGDLRGRSLQLREVDYPTTSFYTKAFGGVFVLRGGANGHLLIFESLEEMNKYEHTYWAEHIASPNLLQELISRGWLLFNVQKLTEERLMRITHHHFAQNIGTTEHKLTEIFTNKSIYLKYLNQLDEGTKKQVIGPHKFIEKIHAGHKPERSRYIADDTFRALHSPANKNMEDLIWRLICHMQPSDPYYMYYYDKELFYRQFQQYNESYQDWIILNIKEQLKNN